MVYYAEGSADDEPGTQVQESTEEHRDQQHRDAGLGVLDVFDLGGRAGQGGLGAKEADVKNAKYFLMKADGVTKDHELNVAEKETVSANSIIRVEVAGVGSYAGNDGDVAVGTYRILEANHDISKAKIKVKEQFYTGKEITLEADDIDSAKIKDTNLVYGENADFVAVSYVKNVNKGTAKVTFKGVGAYGGEKTVTFKISQRNVETEGNWWKDLMDKLFG